LQRIYGTAFFDKKKLKAYLTFLEEAKKRNHRKIGPAMDLFSFHDDAPGMPFFHPKGMDVWNALLDFWRDAHREAGYVETKTPIILQRTLWEKAVTGRITGKTCTPPRWMNRPMPSSP
jgi:threonyl-tRNA synthetase